MPFAVVDDVGNESPGNAVRNSQGYVTDGDQYDKGVNISRDDEVQEVSRTADKQAADGRLFLAEHLDQFRDEQDTYDGAAHHDAVYNRLQAHMA